MSAGPNLQEIGSVLLTPGGSLIVRPKGGHNVVLGAFCEVKKQIDGAYLVKPLAEWISVRDTCSILGLSEGTLARLLDAVFPIEFGPLAGKPVLASRRPSAGVLQILRSDVLRHAEQCRDPEFWTHFKGSAIGLKAACKHPDMFESA